MPSQSHPPATPPSPSPHPHQNFRAVLDKLRSQPLSAHSEEDPVAATTAATSAAESVYYNYPDGDSSTSCFATSQNDPAPPCIMTHYREPRRTFRLGTLSRLVHPSRVSHLCGREKRSQGLPQWKTDSLSEAEMMNMARGSACEHRMRVASWVSVFLLIGLTSMFVFKDIK